MVNGVLIILDLPCWMLDIMDSYLVAMHPSIEP